MERYINIVDYHQRKNNNQILFDKHVNGLHKCPYPWENLVINQFGSTYICASPAWLPKSIGSILDYDNIFSLLNSHEARSIRSEIDLNRYTYCNHNICAHLSEPIAAGKYVTSPISEVDLKFVTEDQFTSSSSVTKLPKEICLDFDYTCNFKCPSCRTEIINHNQGPNFEINKLLVKKIKQLILDMCEGNEEPLTLRWAGGEPFVSKAYLELWEYIIKKKNLKIRNIIQTNGSYLKKRGKLLQNFIPYIDIFRISFDAGNAQTYQKTRVNGNWDDLLDNCKFVKNIIKENNSSAELISDFVVQAENYKEIPYYVDLAKSLEFDKININKMWNWGTWSDDDFKIMNVSDPTHPDYHDLIKILESYKLDPIVYQHVY